MHQRGVVHRGALIEGVFPGPVTLDDAYSTSPYGNFWLITHGIPGTVLAQLLHKLNTKELMAEGRARGAVSKSYSLRKATVLVSHH
eukprot:5552006-Amphidinium_carterae.1